MEHPGGFIIRVYALVINERNEVLLSDEYQLNMRMTKFPGGGLEFGEGPVECIKREIEEECNGQQVSNIRHFYTTDYFQEALFYPNHQLISIYYLAELQYPLQFSISEKPFDFNQDINGNQSFRWEAITNLDTNELTFPIDRKVGTLLLDQFLP